MYHGPINRGVQEFAYNKEKVYSKNRIHLHSTKRVDDLEKTRGVIQKEPLAAEPTWHVDQTRESLADFFTS